MTIVAVIVYLIGMLVTWIYAGYLTGRQFYRMKTLNPTQPIQINWVSVFYQGLAWVGFWASFAGENIEKRWPIPIPQPTLEEVNQRMRAK